MRVLLMNQFFWPDAAATSQLLTDVARQLAAEGHEVHVICGGSGYTDVNRDAAPAVTVHRVAGRRFSRSTLGRLASYASFYTMAAWQTLRIPAPDVVLTLTTPPLLSLLGNLAKITRGARHVIWEMDMYPDVAVDLGYFQRGGVADRVVGLLADTSRRYADMVIALGECMRDRLQQRGVPPEKITVADNWADSRAIRMLPKHGALDRFTVLYSGNFGLAHDFDTIAGAILELRSDSRFLFLFTGGGGRRQQLQELVEMHQLSGVQLRPFVERSDLGYELAQGDVGLVLQSDNCCGSVVPSKVYGLLAAGRPFIFVGPAKATPARIIRQFGCGWHISSGDVASMVVLLRRLAEAPQEVANAAQRAREALLGHYDLPLGTARIVAALTKYKEEPVEALITA